MSRSILFLIVDVDPDSSWAAALGISNLAQRSPLRYLAKEAMPVIATAKVQERPSDSVCSLPQRRLLPAGLPNPGWEVLAESEAEAGVWYVVSALVTCSPKLTRELQSDVASQEQQPEESLPVAGRVAAAAAALSQHRLSTPSGPSSSGGGFGTPNVRCVSFFAFCSTLTSFLLTS